MPWCVIRKLFDDFYHPVKDVAMSRFLTETEDVDLPEVPFRLQYPNLMTATAVLEQHQIADWTGVDFRVKKFAAHFVEHCRKRGIPMFVSRARVPKYGISITPFSVGCAVEFRHTELGATTTHNERYFLCLLAQRILAKLKYEDIEYAGELVWKRRGWTNAVNVQGTPTRMTPRRLLQETQMFDL